MNKDKVLEILEKYEFSLTESGSVWGIEKDNFEIAAVEIVSLFVISDDIRQREQLIDFHKWQQKMWSNPNADISETAVDTYLKSIEL